MKITTIKEFIPTFASSFVILGIIKAMIFYYAFGIRILDYIDFSESLLLFFDDILLIIGPIILAYIGNLLLIKKIKEANIIKVRPFKNIAIVLSLIFLVFNTIYTFLILHRFFHFTNLISGLLASLILIFAGFYFFFIGIQIEKDIKNINSESEPRKKKILKTSFFQKIAISLFLYFVVNGFIYRTYMSLHDTVSNSPEKKITCKLKGNTIIQSGNDTLYLGQTRNNIFFYIRNYKTSLILKLDSVENIETAILKPQQPGFFNWF